MASALELVARGTSSPDIVVADYNLPNGLNGLEIAARLRRRCFNSASRSIILTGDISTDTLREIAHQGCVQLNKPVKPQELTNLVRKPSVQGRQRRRVSAAPTAGTRADGEQARSSL